MTTGGGGWPTTTASGARAPTNPRLNGAGLSSFVSSAVLPVWPGWPVRVGRSGTGPGVRTVPLARPPVAGSTLAALFTSGPTRAAVLHGKGAWDSLERWAVVHETASGAHVATHGPLTPPAACFAADRPTDRFIVLSMDQGRRQLLEVTPADS